MNLVKQEIQSAIKKGLGGEKSHSKLAPFRNTSRSELQTANSSPKLSAVLILLWVENKELYTCLTLRNVYKGAHSAQVSLPGGKMELSDDNLGHTAVRETNEEIGIDKIELIGQLSDVYIPPSGFLVSPFIGIIEQNPQFNPDPIEVAQIFKIQIKDLVNNSTLKTTQIPLGESKLMIKAPFFDLHGQVVWGATAMILSEFKDLILSTKLLGAKN